MKLHRQISVGQCPGLRVFKNLHHVISLYIVINSIAGNPGLSGRIPRSFQGPKDKQNCLHHDIKQNMVMFQSDLHETT